MPHARRKRSASRNVVLDIIHRYVLSHKLFIVNARSSQFLGLRRISWSFSRACHPCACLRCAQIGADVVTGSSNRIVERCGHHLGGWYQSRSSCAGRSVSTQVLLPEDSGRCAREMPDCHACHAKSSCQIVLPNCRAKLEILANLKKSCHVKKIGQIKKFGCPNFGNFDHAKKSKNQKSKKRH